MNDDRHDTLPRTRRLRSIDIARGAAVVLMIATHTAHAFLADSWKHNELWYNLNILFGFVAPAFVFLSGVTLWPALSRRMNGHRANNDPAGNRPDGALEGRGKSARGNNGTGRLARRYLMVLLLGYWLQTPVLSLRQLLYNQRPEELARMFDSNVLQVIAISGLLLLGITAAFRSPAIARVAALLLGIIVAVAAPWVWSSDLYLSIPLPLRMYFASQPPATIPLFPYLAYFTFGFALSPLLITAGEHRRSRLMPLLAGIVLMALGFASAPLLASFPPHDDFWGPGIPHFLFRLGGAITLMALCLMFAARHPSRGRWIASLGRNSLAVYVLHLMLIYGSPMNKGMRYWFDGPFDGTFGPLATALALGAILLLCHIVIHLWDRLRQRRPATALWLKRLWWIVFWILFLLNP